MFNARSLALLASALSAILSFSGPSSVAAAPAAAPQATSTPAASSSSDYWLGDSSFHNKVPVFGNTDSSYKLFRNVQDYGAVGDGVTDDTNAINAAFAADGRCGVGCNSSTTSPAIIYFPSGTYVVSFPIQMDYYSQMIGDANNLPTIQAKANFSGGIAVIDADPYGAYGVNWFINQNNFFRQIRNFVIDLTQIDGGGGSGIHWQVAQATSLQNIVFNMAKGSRQNGIFMDNGSGGFLGDLIFNGGNYGAFFGNQQFTSSNLTFNDCTTAIYMNWNWGWTLAGLTINGGTTGIDASNLPTNQTVGSMVIADSKIGSKYGIRSAYSTSQSTQANTPATGGTLIIDHCDFTSSAAAVVDVNNSTILASGQIDAWASGNVYDQSSTAKATQGTITGPIKAASLLDSNGNIFRRAKPQYEGAVASDFLSAVTDGNCTANGVDDDTQNVQNFLNAAASQGKIAYFDHGMYVVKKTIQVPTNIRIVGECWSTIFASGFNDSSNPQAVWQVGSSSTAQTGSVEISDMLFAVDGSNAGAIMIEWNLQSAQGDSGIWDTHVRIGGSHGSDLLVANCLKDPSQTSANSACLGAFMHFYASPLSSGLYLENTWFWTADHDMEDAANTQISVYTGRGTLIRSQGPVWLWGSASEHSMLYNYQFDGVNALFAGFMQSETPYFQPNPPTQPYNYNSAYDDPTFTVCTSGSIDAAVPCGDAWGLRILNSNHVLIYSTGLYSFFNNYGQTCLVGENCQENMIHIQNSQVAMYAVTTKAAVNMIIDDNTNTTVLGADNRDVYGDTVAYYVTSS